MLIPGFGRNVMRPPKLVRSPFQKPDCVMPPKMETRRCPAVPPRTEYSQFVYSPASIPMRRTDVPMFEYACHEGNYAMPNILAGERAKERVAAATP